MCDYCKFVPRIFVHSVLLSLRQRLAETVEMLFPISLLTYPMVNWCILRKYISRPLLLLQSVPCHPTGSEMCLKPSHPRMHANSASRRNYCSVLQVQASCVTSLNGSCCFPQQQILLNLMINLVESNIQYGVLRTSSAHDNNNMHLQNQ